MTWPLPLTNLILGLIVIIQVWLVWDAVEALPLGVQFTMEGCSSPNSDLIYVDELSKKVDCCIPIKHGTAIGSHVRFLSESLRLPIRRLSFEFEQDRSSWAENYFPEIVLRLNATMQQKARDTTSTLTELRIIRPVVSPMLAR
jgi:hypothetical protein